MFRVSLRKLSGLSSRGAANTIPRVLEACAWMRDFFSYPVGFCGDHRGSLLVRRVPVVDVQSQLSEVRSSRASEQTTGHLLRIQDFDWKGRNRNVLVFSDQERISGIGVGGVAEYEAVFAHYDPGKLKSNF